MKCKICKKHYRHLGSHIWHTHKMYAIHYKEKFGLDHNFALIDDEIKEKKRIAFAKNPVGLKNLLKGKKHQFKKGRTYIKGYVSTQSKKRSLINIIEMNKQNKKNGRTCPICNMKFDNLTTHLYNKHKLIKVK